MKLKTFSLILGLLCSNILLAQNPKVELSDVKTTQVGDSVFVTMLMQVDMEEMPARNQLRLTPVIKVEGKSLDLGPAVLLNGKKLHSQYKRQLVLDKRDGKNTKEQAFEYKGGKFEMNYRGAAAMRGKLRHAEVFVREQMKDINGAVVQNDFIAATKSIQTSKSAESRANAALGTAANDIVQLKQDMSVLYKGSYLEPASDAIFERNQKELRFSLDEAKVIAEINPHMLSLRELYAVAQSYEARPVMFHKIIKKSVELYPSNPIANLNAAASAIELGDIEGASVYLQVAPHDTLAFVNCRGAYELMRNNVQEGLRLLKAASSKGSEEATENLKIFFGSFKEQ